MLGLKLEMVEKNFREEDPKEGTDHATDFVDRLHSRTTVFILGIFASIVGLHFYGNPIDCITSKEIDGVKGWNDYIMDYCFVRGTYRYYGEHFDKDLTTEQKDYVSYYQWIPLFFLFQMICFTFPQVIWTVFQSWFYIDLGTIVKEASIMEAKPAEREEKEDKIADYIFMYFYNRRGSKKGVYSIFWRYPYVITFFYLLIKLLYFVNVLVQLFVICYMLDSDIFWGISEMLHYLNSTTNMTALPPSNRGLSTTQSAHFPVETRCVFSTSHIKWLQHVHQAQCLLPVNYINGKLFLILYFWYFFLATITMISVISYIYNWITSESLNDVAGCVLKSQADSLTRSRVRPYVFKFVKFIGHDGCLILQFIRDFTNTGIYYRITCKLWEKYGEKKGISEQCLPMNDCSFSVGNAYSVRTPFASGDTKTR